MQFKVVIPARLASTRLPSKPLLPLAGRPMILHVCERALASGADQVVVATEDPAIMDVVAHMPVEGMLTSSEHVSGTSRIAEVCSRMGWSGETVVVNLQGDEPLMPPELIAELASTLSSDTDCHVATMAAAMTQWNDIADPNIVKVVMDRRQRALYFSRAAIPCERDRHSVEGDGVPAGIYWRHIGMYAYTAAYLRQYASLEPSPLEDLEKLEQLRVLWHGDAIKVLTVPQAPPPGVDTEADRQRVESILLQYMR